MTTPITGNRVTAGGGVDLVAFLRARLDEDERAAQLVRSSLWRWISTVPDPGAIHGDGTLEVRWPARPDRNGPLPHIARHSPARVLCELEAKRRIVDEHTGSWSHGVGLTCDCCAGGGGFGADWPCVTLRLLALPYDQHAAYRTEWRP